MAAPHQELLEVRTRRGLNEVTQEVVAVVGRAGVRTGLCTVFIRHTSASLVIQENAAPSAARDLETFMTRLAPDGDARYTHTSEGPDDMPAHIRAAVTKTSESIPVVDGRLALGTWQGLLVFEHRSRPHTRRLVVHVSGA